MGSWWYSLVHAGAHNGNELLVHVSQALPLHSHIQYCSQDWQAVIRILKLVLLSNPLLFIFSAIHAS